MKAEVVTYQTQFWLLPVLSIAHGLAVRYPWKWGFAIGWGPFAIIFRWGNRA